MKRRLWMTLLTACTVLGFGALAYFALAPRLILARQRAVTLDLLDSPDPADRARGAWRIIDHPDTLLKPLLVQRVMGDESDSQAREACVYTLGKLLDPAGAPALLYAMDLDESGVVRAAAWLALARVSESQFRERVASRPESADPWEQIGIAQGLLEIGDARGVQRLLYWAASGDDPQRYVASLALYKHLRPLLEAAGRWPLTPLVEEGQTWPPAFVADITRRAATLNLTVLAGDTHAQVVRAERLRSTLRRITNARERIARWLYSE